MECEYFLKDSDIRHLEQIPPHDKLKIFYADNGTMINSKGKFKSCCIIENIAGIYFYYKKIMRHQFQLKQFISIYDIVEIKYIDSKKRLVKTKTKEITFTSDHPDRTVSKLLSARSCLFDQIPDLNPIKISKFPTIPTISRSRPAENNLNISSLRYICQCLRVNDVPIDSMISILNKIEKRTNQTVTIDDKIKILSNLHAISDPIATNKNVTTVCLKKVSPFVVCTLTHLFLKTSTSIQTFIFDGFASIIPPQLKLSKMTKMKRPISFILDSCKFDDASFLALIREFSQFPGEFQRLSFNNIRLTSKMCEDIINIMPRFRSLRTLEMIEMNQIEMTNNLTESVLNSLIRVLLNHCRFLSRITFSFKTNGSEPFPIPVQMNNFYSYSVLSEIVISGQDLTQQFSDNSLKLPSYIRLLDFSRCIFSNQSIQGLFGQLNNYDKPLSLTLSDITITDSTWPQFFESLSSLQPLKCISELDWSGNKLQKDQIDTFCDFFIDPDVFRYLGIDRIFNTKNIDVLNALLESLKKVKKLWGISVGGDSRYNFSGSSFSTLLTALKTIVPFHSLRIDGQQMSEPDLIMLVDFLNENDQICELSCNGSMIQNVRSFFGFFAEVFRRTGLRAISRPVENINQIIEKCKNQGQDHDIFDEEWENFRSKISGLHNVASKSVRSCFFLYEEKWRNGESNEIELYFKFINKFPISFFELGEYDPLLLDYCSKDTSPILSIHQIDSDSTDNSIPNMKLASIQANLLHIPFQAPLDF